MRAPRRHSARTFIRPACRSRRVRATSRSPPWLPLSDAPGSCGGRLASWSSMRDTSGDTTTCDGPPGVQGGGEGRTRGPGSARRGCSGGPPPNSSSEARTSGSAPWLSWIRHDYGRPQLEEKKTRKENDECYRSSCPLHHSRVQSRVHPESSMSTSQLGPPVGQESPSTRSCGYGYTLVRNALPFQPPPPFPPPQ